MVKDKKVDVIARDYTINLHKALHGMYAAPTPNLSPLSRRWQLIALDAHCLEPTLADR